MKYASKIKLTGDDFVLVGMNYNYFMIPRLAYPKENLETLKQQILDNQEMIAELKTVWNKGEQDMVTDEILQTMEKYFGKRMKTSIKLKKKSRMMILKHKITTLPMEWF
jgi:hypothetical protein